MVRNTRDNFIWGEEETSSPVFPFSPGINFEMIIKVENYSLMVAVNGHHFIEYKHRLPLTSIDTLSIDGDVYINAIRFT